MGPPFFIGSHTSPVPAQSESMVGPGRLGPTPSAYCRFFPITTRGIGKISYVAPIPDRITGSFEVKD